MFEALEAFIGFSRRDSEACSPDDVFVPGYPDNPVMPVRCRIGDARRSDTPSLDRHGFTLIEHETAFADERDRDILREGYHDEMADFLKRYMNASRVVASPNGLLVRYGDRLVGRRPHVGRADIIDDRIPASFAHVDYLADAVRQQAATDAHLEGLEDLEYSRMVVVQTWRAVSEPPQDVPLAICDRRTVDEADISPRKGILDPKNADGLAASVFYIGGIHFNPSQKWYYYPCMRSDEVLVFTGFDTAKPEYSRVPHAAFDNRATHPDAHPRESIEARFYAYYD
jgi:hypothetical protein